MVASVSGNGLGVSLSSLAVLGQRGMQGQVAQGRSGEQAFVNVTTGNLVLQGQDEVLKSRGVDTVALRTYNSQGLLNDDNADNWSSGYYYQPVTVTGTLNAAGSTISRTDRDGAVAIYAYNAAQAKYVSTAGAGAYDSIVYDAAASRLVWTDGDTGVIERYEATGARRMVSLVDASGNQSSFTYNTANRITSVVNSSGQTLFYDYSGANLTQVRSVGQDANGLAKTLIRTRYTYDTSNRLSQVRVDLSPDDSSIADNKLYRTTYTYDGTSKRVASVTQTDGTVLTVAYVQVGAEYRVASVTDALGQVTAYTYDVANKQTTVTDALGLVTRFSYDAQGQLTQIQVPAVGGVSQITTMAYDANGNVATITDASGRAVNMTYDASGNQVSQMDNLGNTVTRTFNTKNQVLTETRYAVADPDQAGALLPSAPMSARYVYDTAGKNQLLFAVSAEGRVTEHRYNANGQRVATIAYQGNLYAVGALAASATPTLAQMQAWVNSAAVNKALTQRVDMAYDANGQLKTTTQFASVNATGVGVLDGKESVTQYVYDQRGLLLKTVSATNGASVFTYDGLGRLLTASDALANTTVSAYDDAGNKTAVTRANGLVTTSVFDKAGRLTSLTDSSAAAANLSKTTYNYDAAGRLRMVTDATGQRQWMLYDEASRKVASIDADGTLTEYLYDASNNVTRTKTYATAVAIASLVSGGLPANVTLGTIRPAANAADVNTWAIYDSANRLLKSIDASGAVTENFYDGANRLVKTTGYATRLTAAQIAALGDTPLSSAAAPAVNASNDRTVRQFYDNDGLLRGVLDAEGYLSEMRYNAAGQLTENIAYGRATATAQRAAGTLAQLIPTAQADDQKTYSYYNNKGQLSAQIDAQGYLTERVYDRAGNLTTSTRYATPISVAVSASTVIASVRPASSAQDQAVVNAYDSLNRLTSSTDAFGVVTTYTYDTVGNVVSTSKAANTAEVRTMMARFDVQGRKTAELSAQGASLITASMTQAQVDALWAQYAVKHAYDAANRGKRPRITGLS